MLSLPPTGSGGQLSLQSCKTDSDGVGACTCTCTLYVKHSGPQNLGDYSGPLQSGHHKCKRLHKPEEISCTPDLWHAVHTVHVHHVHVYTMCMYLLCFSSSSCAFCSRSSCILFSSSLCFYSHVQYMCKYMYRCRVHLQMYMYMYMYIHIYMYM